MLTRKAKLTRKDLETLYKLRDMIATLSSEELIVFGYVWDNISVGEILFERDLYRIHRVQKPILVARRLREKGLIERGEGCYNLARWLRPLRKKIQSFNDLRALVDQLP